MTCWIPKQKELLGKVTGWNQIYHSPVQPKAQKPVGLIDSCVCEDM